MVSLGTGLNWTEKSTRVCWDAQFKLMARDIINLGNIFEIKKNIIK